MLNNILIIITSISMSSTAHVLLKKGMMRKSDTGFATTGFIDNAWATATNLWILGGMCLHVSALIVWLWALSRVDITFAYPFLALGYIIVSLMAWLWLGEELTLAKLLGMSIIMIGIVVLSFDGKATT